ICDGTVCCAAACPNAGSCQQCVAGTGACQAVINGTDNSCSGNNICSATSQCLLATGQPSPGGAATCATGFSADGFCCDKACTDSCDVCAASLGPTTNGACATAPQNYAGSPAC